MEDKQNKQVAETKIEDTKKMDAHTSEQIEKSDLLASYRTQRDNAVRKAHAYATMLKAHGISTDTITDASLQQITIHAGEADSPFEYKAPKISVPAPVKTNKTEPCPQPTLEEVKTWGEDKINDNWDMVKNLMRQGVK